MSEPQVTAMIAQLIAMHKAAVDEMRTRITADLATGEDPIRVWGSLVVQLHQAYGLGDEHREVSMAFASALFPDGWW